MTSNNLEIYNRKEVADQYAAMDYLTPCEKSLFDEFIKPGSAILDLGVGGGRTTPYLFSRASRYIGVDYSAEMVSRCQKKYPDCQFMLADASDLKTLESVSFDAVVFTFNGIDYVIPDEARNRCLAECWRVLKPNGVVVFSSHNARAIFVRPAWNRDRVRRTAERVAGGGRVARHAIYCVLNIAAASRACFRALWGSVRRIIARLPQRAFWKGRGLMLDPVHGGLLTHYSTPDHVRAEINNHGFNVTKVLPNDHPNEPHRYSTDWFYYVCVKSDC
jgi:SAM-dependent methyltransferase